MEAERDKEISFGFWRDVSRPFFALAPMADVTDCVFRSIIAKYSRHGEERGGPDVLWTEFVSADGLMHKEAREALLVDLRYTEKERPIVAQIFSAHPDMMEGAAALCRELGFDGIDINMGCPERKVVKQGAGCGLIQDPKLAQEVIYATKAGAAGLPVSVKTRIGFNKNEIDTWVPALLETGIPLLTMHLRTRKEMSKVPARWELMEDILSIRDSISPETLIAGNGDVVDMEDAEEKTRRYRCDGVMLGRAIFGNPWLFDRRVQKSDIPLKEQLRVLVEHTKHYEEELGAHKNFSIMKKHYKAYVSGFDGAKELRGELMEAESAQAVAEVVEQFLRN